MYSVEEMSFHVNTEKGTQMKHHGYHCGMHQSGSEMGECELGRASGGYLYQAGGPNQGTVLKGLWNGKSFH